MFFKTSSAFELKPKKHDFQIVRVKLSESEQICIRAYTS